MALNFPQSPEVNDTYTSGGNTWRWNGIAWNIVATVYDASQTPIPTDLSDLTDTTNIIPDSILDLGITDGSLGQVLTTDGAGSFSFTSVSGGGGGASALNDLSDVTITGASTGQVLKYNGSIWVNDTDSTGTGGGSSTFADLTDTSAANLTIDKVYEPAIAMLRINNNGATSYVFDSHYTGDNPTIVALAGATIAFDLTEISGHPLEIQNSIGNAFNTGLVHVSTNGVVSTGSSAQGKSSGTLYWRVPENISGTYRYQCQVHAGMVGGITVKRLSVI